MNNQLVSPTQEIDQTELTRFKETLTERVQDVAGLLQVYIEELPEEIQILSVLDCDRFDERLENEIYDIHYDLLEIYDLPIRFVCLPRVALQAGVPGKDAQLVFSRK